jgi:hypothetical protein
MPAIIPFALEYLIGGLQTFTIIFLALSRIDSGTFDPASLGLSNSLLQLLCLLAFAYPVGIIIDNIAAHFLSPLLDQDSHRANYNLLLGKSDEYKLKRVVEFQTSKRIIRITLANLMLAESMLLILLITQTIEVNMASLSLGIFAVIVFVPGMWAYLYIGKNYEKYLTEMIVVTPKSP